MCRRFPCGCVLDSRWGKDRFTWFPTAFFSVPPRGFMTEKAAQDALDALNKGQHLLPQVVGCLMDIPTCPKNIKKRGIRLPLLTYIDQHRPFWSILIRSGGFWVSKNLDKPKSCSQAKSSWMAISWRFADRTDESESQTNLASPSVSVIFSCPGWTIHVDWQSIN